MIKALGSLTTSQSTVWRWVRSDRGQVLPVVAVMLTLFLGVTGFAVDLGRVMLTKSELQAATDAAAMAGAQALPNSTAVTQAATYSGVAGAHNVSANLPPVTRVSGYPLAKCLKTLLAQGQACLSPAGANAVQVKEQTVLPMTFASFVGYKSMTIQASATAASRGGAPTPYNVAIILDTTASMNIVDSDCGATQIACALSGIRTFLANLNPCAASVGTCTTSGGVAQNAVDQVALFTFPNQSVASIGVDSSCTQPIPGPINNYGFYTLAPYGNLTTPYGTTTPWAYVAAATAWSFPSQTATSYAPMSVPSIINGQNIMTTYQITGFLSDYRASSTATSLNTNSTLVKAVGGTPGCGGILPPNYEAVYDTYYAGVFYAAKAALLAQQSANPGTQNVIIFLSDGDANAPVNNNSYAQLPGGSSFNYTVLPSAGSSGLYPSSVDECGQAVKAAADAAALGIHVYSIAYGSEATGCSTDTVSGYYSNGTSYKSASPCNTMASIASAPQYFYSDTYNVANANPANCAASQPVQSLSAIFTSIAADLTTARLIPDSVT